MTTTPGAGRRLSVRPMSPTVGNVASEYEVAEDVGERDEEKPPDPPLPVRPPLAQLDDGEVEGQHQRHELDGPPHREEENQEHATGIVGYPVVERNRGVVPGRSAAVPCRIAA